MGAISGLVTTFNSLNYTGELFQLSPTDAPFFTMAGGLSGGMQTTSTEFEWETTDLRTPTANNTQLEGADAPTAEGRTRSNVTNVCEIHMATVDVSFTKMAAYGQKSGSNNEEANPIVDEFAFQLSAAITSKKQDLELSFLTGAYQKPSDNSTARKTRGIIPAITTNKTDVSIALAGTLTTATNGTFTCSASHGLNTNNQIIFSDVDTNTELSIDTPYWVTKTGSTTFTVSATKGGSAITFAATGAPVATQCQDLTETDVGDLLQLVFDNGGLTETPTFTLWTGSWNKRKLTDIYIKNFGSSGYFVTNRTVGGVSVSTIDTDFGTLNVAVNRWMPKHKLLFASMQEVAPVFLDVPKYGHFFVKPLPSSGAYEKSMLYGEIGLAYGAEKHHGLIVNTTIG